MYILINILLISVVTYFLMPIVIRILRVFKIFDVPNSRSNHQKVVVRGGGIVFSVSLMGVITLFALLTNKVLFLGILSSLVLISFISFLDDIISLSIKVRLISHFLASNILVLSIFRYYGLTFQNIYLIWLVIAVSILVVGFSNAYNFMDGVNGLVTCQSLVTSIYAIYCIYFYTGNINTPYSFIISVLAGSSLGFLPYNFPNARIFMGDIGSICIGFFSATVILWGYFEGGLNCAVSICLLHVNFLLDTSITLLARMKNKVKWWSPHKDHFYQKLIKFGYSHFTVTSIIMVIQVAVVCMSIRYNYAGITERVVIVITVIVLWILFYYNIEKRYKFFKLH